jgi:hypothetical protein
MVTVPLQQHFDRHTQKSSSLPRTGSSLHQPCRRRVSEDVRCYIRSKTGIRHNVGEGFFDRFDRSPVPLHRETLPAPFPPAQVRQQLSWNRNRRLPLVRLAPPRGAPIKDAPININPSSTNRWMQCGSANRARSRAGVKAHQNELGDVSTASPICFHALLHLAVAPRCSNQRCSFLASEPALPGWMLVRQGNGHNLRAKSFATMIVDSSSQIFEELSAKVGDGIRG